jgi:NADH-quinone oxidoreductase subunit N
MNYSLLILEYMVLALGLGVLLADLWLPAERRRDLGLAAAGGVLLILLASFAIDDTATRYAFSQMYVLDGLAMFFKRFFLVAAFIVLVMASEFEDRIPAGISEYFSLILFALLGMMFCASSNDFAVLFVALELVTVTFYVLVSFQRSRLASLEAGIKYLIIGAVASAFMVYGIALVFGMSGTLNFLTLSRTAAELAENNLFFIGLVLVLVGLGFKIAMVPFQIWAPDVYQGSPAPTTAFLAVGSKAAGIVLLLRVLFNAVPALAADLAQVLMVLAGATILYGSLCAIPQRNLKRLLGYSSIANAGFILLGVVALSHAGQSAVLYYLGGYLFTVLAAFSVITLALRNVESEDITALNGLNERSPFLAATMTMAMVSLAGVPPLAGFFGKFLLLKSVLAQGAANPAYYWLIAIAIFGVVASFYYYFGIIRAIYWGKAPAESAAIEVRPLMRVCLYACIGGMLYLGLYPADILSVTEHAVALLATR